MKEKFDREKEQQINLGKLAEKIYNEKTKDMTQEEIKLYNESLQRHVELHLNSNSGIKGGKEQDVSAFNNWELYSQIDTENSTKVKRR